MNQKHTPLMQQYHDIKKEFLDTLIFFQVGDFYELFFDDAKQAAAYLGIALTSRGKNNGEPIPLCGVPLHAKDHYLTKLIKGGFKVAVCDQQEEAKPGKLVARAISQVLTPGTLTDSQLLDDKSASYLFSFYPGQDEWGLVFGELLTAQLWATTIPAGSDKLLESELARFFPDELLIPNIKSAKQHVPIFKKQGYFTTLVDGTIESQAEWIGNFNQSSQKVIQDNESIRLALFYFYAYLRKTEQNSLDQFTNLYFYQSDDFLHLDAATQRNLELIKNSHDGSHNHTLFAVLDGASTPMGSRMVKKWLQRPLLKQEAIRQRQEGLRFFLQDVSCMQIVQQLLASIGDVERVVGRIALWRSQLHDYTALQKCLERLPGILEQVTRSENPLLRVICTHLSGFEQLWILLKAAFPESISSDQIIKAGYDQQLDHMRDLVNNSTHKLLALEAHEQDTTGIQSLKIRYNNVHGYYIEVTKANQALVPERYVRRQTLVGKERYTTPELQQLESEIMHARNQIAQREKEVFDVVKKQVAQWVGQLRKLAHALAHLDALHGFAKIAYNNNYICPTFNEYREFTIVDGRHPIVETLCDGGFIPNDTQINDEQSLQIITGPNMGGKSTYLRQVALLSVMAQCGSFVPAQSCSVPLLDRIFTRIGAGDNLAAGKSTFLVEMEETAAICTQATSKSLVILDEVGRGTSTFDGLALAQAVVEYIYNKVQSRCLFATHYHELSQLSTHHPGIASLYAASKKTDSGIIFLYKMRRGVADGSFGIEVAKLADVPPVIVARAQEILEGLPDAQEHKIAPSKGGLAAQYEALLDQNKALKKELDTLKNEVQMAEDLKGIDLDSLSPKQAFDLLYKWRQSG